MSFKPHELFVFFVLPFIAGGFFRWAYVHAHKWIRFASFWSLGVVVLWLFWDSPNADVRTGVAAKLALVGIPSLIVAWLWPWLVRFVTLPYRLFNRFLGAAKDKP